MYKEKFNKYLNSPEYLNIEQDKIYCKLQNLLINSMPRMNYLDIEELLHEEILFKLEQGFKEGYNCGINEKRVGE